MHIRITFKGSKYPLNCLVNFEILLTCSSDVNTEFTGFDAVSTPVNLFQPKYRLGDLTQVTSKLCYGLGDLTQITPKNNLFSLHKQFCWYQIIPKNLECSFEKSFAAADRDRASTHNFSNLVFGPVLMCFNRNIGQVKPKIIYFYYQQKYFLDQSVEKIVYFILKTEAFVWTVKATDFINYVGTYSYW